LPPQMIRFGQVRSGGMQRRDGSFVYHMREPIVSNDASGLGPFILAGLELAALLDSTPGK
ncbi:MAG: hypothetical protein ACLFU2_09910, partial [Opitutales bacterium]